MLVRMLSFPIRWIAFLGVVGLAIYWGFEGLKVSQSAGLSATAPTPEETTAQIIKKLRIENPQAADELTRIREHNDIRAVAAVLSDASSRGGLAGVQRLVDRGSSRMGAGRIGAGDQATGLAHTPYEFRLASLAVDPNLLPDTKSREEFLWAHGSALEILDHDSSGAQVDAYLQRLEKASHSADDWRIAKNNAMALVVLDSIAAANLRQYYEQEQDWLDDAIVEVAARADVSDTERRALIGRVVTTAQSNRPYFKQAVTDLKFGPEVFFLFEEYGEVIRRAVGSGGLPLDEVLEVIFANGDFLDRFKLDPPQEIAARLVYLRNQKPTVWQAARKISLALRLNEDAPREADKIFEKYTGDDVAALIYAGYEHEVPQAAASIAKFGDLGIYILNRYSQSKPFHAALAREDVGPRVIPYVAKFGDAGLERLEANRGWLDKYFAADGTPKEEAWWTQIPGGSAANIARNWVKGYPSEWGELGWAALDVADAALAVASFGSSEVVTESVKESGEIAVKNLSRTEAKAEILRAGQKRAAQTIVGDGARDAARAESQSLLRRAVAEGGAGLARVVKGPAGRAWAFALTAGRTAMIPAEKVLEAASSFRKAWSSVPAPYRKLVYRSLLAVGLTVTISQRTIPALGKIGEAAGKFAGDLVRNTGEAVAGGLKTAVESALGSGGGAGHGVAWGIYIVGLLVLAGLAWRMFPGGKRKLRYA